MYRHPVFDKQHKATLKDTRKLQQTKSDVTKAKHLQQKTHSTLQLKEETVTYVSGTPLRPPAVQTFQKAFLILSRIHHEFHLQHKTIYLAYELFLRLNMDDFNPEDQKNSSTMTLLVCTYLAVKY